MLGILSLGVIEEIGVGDEGGGKIGILSLNKIGGKGSR